MDKLQQLEERMFMAIKRGDYALYWQLQAEMRDLDKQGCVEAGCDLVRHTHYCDEFHGENSETN